MTRPVRLQLSRARGFNLQAHSLATNGLPAVKVTRPGLWGNPFIVHPQHKPGRVWRGPIPCNCYISVPTREDAVECFAEMMATEAEPRDHAFELRKRLPELRGKNLACWCPRPPCGERDVCHAAVLLELASR